MTFVETLWEAADDDGNECELDKVADVERPYQLSMTKGHWSGYPTIALTREQLKDLNEATAKALES
jgi:hypothetical protein